MPLIKKFNPDSGRYEAPPIPPKQKSLLERVVILEKLVAKLIAA